MAVRNNTVNEGFEAAGLNGADSEQYRAALHGYLLRRLHNAEDARDLAQETYLRFYQLSDTDAVRRPSAYLFRIAVNLVYEFRLKRGRDCVTYDSQIAEALADSAPELSSADPVDQLAVTEQIDRIVSRIPRTYRKAFIMHKRDGLSCQEIATALQLTRRSVEIYLARAIAFARNARWK